MSHPKSHMAHIASKSIDTDKLKDQAADVATALSAGAQQAGEHATVLAGQARDAALQARDWGTPKVEAFVEWITPRVEQAWNETVKAAAPRVEKVAEKAGPVIDTAHDKLVDEIIPAIVASLQDAAEKATEREADNPVAATVGDLKEQVSSGAAHMIKSIQTASAAAPIKLVAATAAVETLAAEKKSRKGWWIVGGIAAASGALILWRRAQPTTDPWAEPWEKVDTAGFPDVQTAVGDAAEAVGEVAGTAVAKSREVSGKVADSVEDLSEKVTEKVTEVKGTAKKATTRAKATVKSPVTEPTVPTTETAGQPADDVEQAADTGKTAAKDAKGAAPKAKKPTGDV